MQKLKSSLISGLAYIVLGLTAPTGPIPPYCSGFAIRFS